MVDSRWHRWMIGLGMAGLLCLASGCHSISVNLDPFVNQKVLDERPPRSIAILPTTDTTQHPELRAPMRKALYSALAALPFDDRELPAIDAFIARKAVERGCTPDQLPQELLTDPALADCVVYTEITHVSRLYLFVYSHYRIDLNLLMADTRTREIVYRNRFVFHDRAAAPPFDVVGLLGSSAYALWHLRPEELNEAMEDGARSIAAALPMPQFDPASTPNLRLTDVQVQVPRDILRQGDTVSVRVEATPNCRSTFSLGSIAREQPLVEVSPGHYLGSYLVRPGDNIPFVMVEVQFQSAANNESVTYTETRHPFAIDTQPPPRARVIRGRRLDAKGGMYLDLELYSWETLTIKDPPVEYLIYRRLPGESPMNKIGQATELTFYDKTARADQTYEYCVITVDRAGNRSANGDVRRLNLVTE